MVKIVNLFLQNENSAFPTALIETDGKINYESTIPNDRQFDKEIIDFIKNNFANNEQVREAYYCMLFGEYDLGEIMLEHDLIEDVDTYNNLEEYYNDATNKWNNMPSNQQYEILEKYIDASVENYGFLIEYIKA